MAQAAWGQMEGNQQPAPQGHPGAIPEQPSISLSAQAELELELSLRGSLLLQQQRRIVCNFHKVHAPRCHAPPRTAVHACSLGDLTSEAKSFSEWSLQVSYPRHSCTCCLRCYLARLAILNTPPAAKLVLAVV